MVNKSLKGSMWVQSQEWQNDLCLFQRQTIQHHSNPSLCLNHWCLRSWTFLWRPTRPSRINTKKKKRERERERDVLFIIEDWNEKVGSQEIPRVGGSNRQVWPSNTKWSRTKANRVLPRERTSHSKHTLPTTRDNSTHGHHQMVNTKIRLIIFFAAKDGEALYSQQNKTGSWLWLRSWTPYCKTQT